MSETPTEGAGKTFALDEDNSAMEDFVWLGAILLAIGLPLWMLTHSVSPILTALTVLGGIIVVATFVYQVSTDVRKITIGDDGLTIETAANKTTVPWSDVESVDGDYVKGESSHFQVNYKDGEFRIPCDMESANEAIEMIQKRVPKKSEA